ncbi:universal stress protein [Lacinutrix sp. MedPE-SW]|uniref:universal stress protein n=1 Tax=Lacinutrix sp. MedPE-SW TaxID=1860087 RepID=UPI0009249AE9|nr:universal stress protein [Lacinutrix sp. MedPE-SW]OIQ18741.1 MAG: hypothetical protein BM549_11285 [Lacinutrix sp. MedPE-SW]
MKNVLIPTDFSNNAWNATVYALEYFKNYKVNFILVHIEHPEILPPAFETLSHYISGEILETHRVEVALNKKKEAMLKVSNVEASKIKTETLESNFTQGIKHFVTKYNIDLIVCGTQGLSANKNKIVGQHAQQIITKIKCPVLIIPTLAKFTIPVNIAFPTDYNFIYKNKVLNTLSKISALHNSSIKVIRIVNPKLALTLFQEKNRSYLKDYFKNTASSFHRVNHIDFQQGLQAFISSMKIDMVAIIAKNLNFFETLLFKPTVVKMSYHTQVPFLVLHE